MEPPGDPLGHLLVFPCYLSLGCYNKISSVGCLKQQTLLLTILEVKSKIKVLVPVGSWLRYLFLAYRWLPSCSVLTWWRESKFSGIFL